MIKLSIILTHMTNIPKNSISNDNAPKNYGQHTHFLVNNRWLILVAAFIALLYLLLPVLTPFLIAAILAYICDPLVDKICLWGVGKFKLGRTLATVLVMLAIMGIMAGLVLILIPLLQKESQLLAERLPNVIANIRATVEPFLQKQFGISLNIDPTQIQEIVTKNWKTAGGLFGNVLISAGSHGMALIGLLANILLLPVVLFYLLRDWDELVLKISGLIPLDIIGKTTEIAREIDLVIAEFLRGQLAVMLAMSAFYVIGLWSVGLNMALPIGLVAGLLGFVPYLGITAGILLALLVAALQFTALAQIIPVLLVFGVGQIVESFLLTPRLVGERIGLHPVVVIFALLAGGQLFGFAGILLALPVSAAIAVGLRHTKDSYLSSDAYLN